MRRIDLEGSRGMERIVDWLAEEFRKENGIDLRQNELAVKRLTEAAQKAQLTLATQDHVEINLPFIAATQSKPLHLKMSLTREKLNELMAR